MITNFSIPTLTPSNHRFKPYSIHCICVNGSIPGTYQKRYYKHIHRLSLIHKNKPFLKRNLMPKTLHSVCLVSLPPGKNKNLPSAIVKKLVKPYRKSLRNLRGDANHPEIQKLLPLLTGLKMNLTKDSLRILSFHSDVKKLHFTVFTERSAKIIGEQLLMKEKIPLSKSLGRIKDLTTLSMRIVRTDAQAAWLLFEIISQNAHLDSLNGFSLDLVEDSLPFGFQKLHEKEADIAKILAKLTHFSSNSSTWYYSIISSGKLDNLSVLRLQFASTEIYSNSKDLLQFHTLPKLHKFIFSFTAHYETSERNFFENFTLPSSLEDFNLTLTGFTLSDSSLNNKFFNRLQEEKGVKALELTIVENHNNSAFTAQFACLFIKYFDNLETMKFRNSKGFFSGPFGKKDHAPAKPLEFEDIWAAVGNSKETLQSISVCANEIIFPEDISVLETGFPKLQKLELQDSVSSTAELGRFCQKIPSLREITLKGVNFQDEEGLRIFLDGMKDIPKGGNFALYLDVESIQQELLIGCLKKYIKDVKVKGRLGIHFKSAKVDDEQAFGEILKLVVGKGCFEPFSIVKSAGALFPNELFSVMKTDVIKNACGLNLN